MECEGEGRWRGEGVEENSLAGGIPHAAVLVSGEELFSCISHSLACIARFFHSKDTPSAWTYFIHINPHFLVSFTSIPMVMVKEKVAHAQDAHNSNEKPLIQCYKCGEPCKGEVLRVQSKHFHLKCFTCKVCGCDLAQGGFFMKNGDYLCTLDYQRMHGTRCNGCGDFVEGEVVTALGKTYHPACFVCTICKRPFPAGDRVTFNGKDCLCQYCVQPTSPGPGKDIIDSNCCTGCGRDIKNGQALLALERQWHLGCFKCKACQKVLTGEYISKDGTPYCEKDYQVHFGVQCEACQQFITGKVLEAGDKHYHPSCARCSRCNQMFTEGEEMYLQGSTVWHPGCKNTTRTEERHRERPSRSSSESICSRPGSSIPGSPGHTIYLHTARRERSSMPDDKVRHPIIIIGGTWFWCVCSYSMVTLDVDINKCLFFSPQETCHLHRLLR
uniref:Actin binding LIM protein 1a n=1 Tax=Oncorhynchus kisutch TaxID=8019 RepID=A0A8C7H9B2_ONCKI